MSEIVKIKNAREYTYNFNFMFKHHSATCTHLVLAHNRFDAETADLFKSGRASMSSANCDDTHASPHFKFVNRNFKAFVHCSSELNWIL